MKQKKVILTVVVTALVLLIAGSGGYLLFKSINTRQSGEKYDELASKAARASDETVPSGSASAPFTGENAETGTSGEPLTPNPYDFAYLTSQNPDIYAWIEIPNTNVNYPVLQSDHNDNFYIDHDFEKAYSYPGAIYSQFCNKKAFSDRVTVLYGHNMKDGSMFATLHNFEDSGFFEANSGFSVHTADKRLDYEIVAAFDYDDRHIMNSFDFSDDKVYSDFLQSVQSPHAVNGNVRQGVTLGTEDKLLILSTCRNFGEGRYLVVGRLKSETPLAPTS